MSEEFSIDVDKKSIEELKKAINYDEIETRHQRFMNGTETEDDLINGIYHYKIQNDKGLDLDVVEMKYYNKVIDLYNKEKEKNERLVDRTIKYDNTLEHLQRDTISKDKIREKIIEVKNRLVKDEFITASQGKLNTIIDLEELLEERN